MNKSVRKILTGLLISLTNLAVICTTGCSSEEPIGCKSTGYFRVPGPGIMYWQTDYNEGSVDFKMTGTTTERVIPIVYIAFDWETYKSRPFWEQETWLRDGRVYMPQNQYESDGYESYPNTLDYTYTFHWATFSTVKEQGRENGLLRVSYKTNPYNVPREITAYLENEDCGTFILYQYANPDGIDPPEGTFAEDGLLRGW